VAAGYIVDERAVVEKDADDSRLNGANLAGVRALVHPQHGAVCGRHVGYNAVPHVELTWSRVNNAKNKAILVNQSAGGGALA
jgi:hypothetical protein